MTNFLFTSLVTICPAERNCLGIFGREPYQGHLCEIILGDHFRFLAMGDILFSEQTVLAILVEGLRDIIFEFRSKITLFLALVVILFGGAEAFRQFCRRH